MQQNPSISPAKKRPFAPPPEVIAKPDGIAHIVAIASGKGGVGKSTVSANIAVALARDGVKVGLLDADFSGHSQSVMLHTHVSREALSQGEAAECFGVKVASLGFLYPENNPVIWRGPMFSRAIKSLLTQTRWGILDYLFIDLPPGTSDAQLTVMRDMQLDGGIIVTTPDLLSLQVAERGLKMLGDLGGRTLGVVENMSGFSCRRCGERTDPWGAGAGRALAEKYEVPLLGAIPIELVMQEALAAQIPLVLYAPQSPAAQALLQVARTVRETVP